MIDAERYCRECDKVLPIGKFDVGSWKKLRENNVCRDCSRKTEHTGKYPLGSSCPIEKTCIHCGESKTSHLFYKRKNRQGDVCSENVCMDCRAKIQKAARVKRVASGDHVYLEKLRVESSKRYHRRKKIPESLEKIRKNGRTCARKRRQTVTYRLHKRMSERMRRTLRTGKQGRSWLDMVPYSVEELVSHIESRFTEGMTWEKLLNGEIHIDHIMPVSLFDFDSPNDKGFSDCWALKNLQPLWAVDNIQKGNKVNTKWQHRKKLQSTLTCQQGV